MRVFTKEIQKRDLKVTNPGSRYVEIHKIRIDDNGHKKLMATGEKKNAYMTIQKHADEVEKLRQTVENNTKVMVKLCTVLGVDYGKD